MKYVIVNDPSYDYSNFSVDDILLLGIFATPLPAESKDFVEVKSDTYVCGYCGQSVFLSWLVRISYSHTGTSAATEGDPATVY